MDFSLLQNDSNGGGWGSVSTFDDDSSSGGSGLLSSFENLGVNLAAAAGTVAIQGLGNKLGVSSAYTNPASIAYNSSLLTRRPGSVSPVGAAIGVSGSTLVWGGVLIILGIAAIRAFGRG